MKHFYLLFLCLCCFPFLSAGQALTNGSFETWTDQTALPDGWGELKSEGADWFAPAPSAQAGSKALWLTVPSASAGDSKFFSSPLLGTLAPGEYLIEFYLKGKGRLNSIFLVKDSELPKEDKSNYVPATSNVFPGQTDITSWRKYQAYVVIPEGNDWGNSRLHFFFNQTEAGEENAFLLDNITMQAAPVPSKALAFYLKNLPIPRIGTDTDEDIIRDLRADDILVFEIDCSSYPAESPALEEKLLEFHMEVPGYLAANAPADVTPDLNTIFYVPAGYRVARNVPIWNIKEFGAPNVLDRVLEVYNKEVVNKYYIPKVASADEMVNQKGHPLDYDLRIDFIYPSGSPTEGVPLLLNFSSNTPRFRPFSPATSNKLEVKRRAIYPLGFLCSGYAFANLDHCYIPLSRSDSDNYGYFDRYSLEDFNGVAYLTSAIRYIHSSLGQYNLNGRIGTMGISKASYSAVISANTNNADMSEHSSGFGTPPAEQPYPGFKSHADVAYAAAGNGTRRTGKAIDSQSSPMITSIGKLDSYNHWPLYPDAINPLIEAGIVRLDLWMEELGHTYPVSGTDYTTGMERYPLFKTFFDRFLKPEEHVNPEIYYALPRENFDQVYPDGSFHALLPKYVLPDNMQGVSPIERISVRFLSPMNTETIASFLKVIDLSTGEEAPGTWEAGMKNTCFSFTPAEELTVQRQYKLQVLAQAEDADGNKLLNGMERVFTTTKAPAPPSIGENCLPNGDMEDWKQTDGVYNLVPEGYAKGVGSNNWTAHATGRGESGNALQLRQPSTDNGQHRRLDFPVLQDLTPGTYVFSAYFKGVGTIRWVKLSKGAAFDSSLGTAANFITTTNINASDWEEISTEVSITEESDYHLSMSFFKTTDDNNPFLLDDISFRKKEEQSSIGKTFQAHALKVYAQGKSIVIEEEGAFQVYTISGQLLASGEESPATPIPAENGLYLVTTKRGISKLIVR